MNVPTSPEAVVRTVYDRLNAHDLDGYYALCSDDLVYTGMTTLHGKASARAFDEPAFAALPDHWRRVDRLLVSGEVVAVWLVLGGTPLASGTPFEVEFCNIFEVRGGLVTSITMYTDWPALMQKLGA